MELDLTKTEILQEVTQKLEAVGYFTVPKGEIDKFSNGDRVEHPVLDTIISKATGRALGEIDSVLETFGIKKEGSTKTSELVKKAFEGRIDPAKFSQLQAELEQAKKGEDEKIKGYSQRVQELTAQMEQLQRQSQAEKEALAIDFRIASIVSSLPQNQALPAAAREALAETVRKNLASKVQPGADGQLYIEHEYTRYPLSSPKAAELAAKIASEYGLTAKQAAGAGGSGGNAGDGGAQLGLDIAKIKSLEGLEQKKEIARQVAAISQRKYPIYSNAKSEFERKLTADAYAAAGLTKQDPKP